MRLSVQELLECTPIFTGLSHKFTAVHALFYTKKFGLRKFSDYNFQEGIPDAVTCGQTFRARFPASIRNYGIEYIPIENPVELEEAISEKGPLILHIQVN